MTCDYIAIIISIVSLIISILTFSVNTKRARKEATLDAYNDLQEQSLDALNKYDSEVIQNIVNDNEEYAKITKYLARVEHFCVG